MKKTMRIVVIVAVVICAGVGVGAYYVHHPPPAAPEIAQFPVSRGDIVEASIATGSLVATRTVSIGTQVSGIVTKLYVDYNSIVHKGEVLARLDDTVFAAQLASAQATLERTKIDRGGEKDVYDEDKINLTRTRDLHAKDLATAQELEAADVQVKADQAQLDEDDRTIEIAQEGVSTAQANLDYCTITSPIDGVVITRSVDEGQAVAAAMSAPTLYVLGTDLSALLLMGDMDESDIANVRPGEGVNFTVESYRTTFTGHVVEMRLSPSTSNNVVTYQTVVDVLNPDLLLRPGMTASYKVETGRANDVLRMPSQALRFRPSADMFAVLHQTAPPPLPATPATSIVDANQPGSGFKVKENGTIDTHFAPVQHPTHAGVIWILDHQQLERVPVVTGLSDGAWTQIISGNVHDGEEVVGGMVLPKHR